MSFFTRHTSRGYREDATPPQFEGELHRQTIHHAVGWARDKANPTRSVTVEAVVIDECGERAVSTVVADAYYGPLSLRSYDDVRHGFQLIFDPPLTSTERDSMVIRPAGTKLQLKLAAMPELPFSPYDDDRRSPVEGFVDAISLTHVAGWMVNRRAVTDPLDFEVCLVQANETKIIARGTADRPYAGVESIGSMNCGFKLAFSTPLTIVERNNLQVRVPEHDSILPRAPSVHGYIDKLDPYHVVGWVRDRFRPEDRLAFEVILTGPDGKQTLAAGVADKFHAGLAAGAPEDGFHGFRVDFSTTLTPEQVSCVSVRITAPPFTLPFSFPRH